MTLLRIWFIGSGALLLGFALYAYAPLLLVFLLVTAGFGLLAAGIVVLARRFAPTGSAPPDA